MTTWTASPSGETIHPSDFEVFPADDDLQELHQAIMVSLFSDARADDDDDLPSGSPDDDRRGWWADAYSDVPGDSLGSRLWLLDRSTLTDQTVSRAERYARDALQWMLDDGVADQVLVTADRNGERLELEVTVTRVADPANPVTMRWESLWEGY